MTMGLNLDLNGIDTVIIQLSVPENYAFDNISVNILLVNLPLRMLEVHINGIRGITIHIIESKIHISYFENHDSTLMLFY